MGANSSALGQLVTVRAYKYDCSEHRVWQARLKERSGPLIVLDARFEEEVNHDLLGTIAKGTLSLEYYWLDRWYSVFRFAAAADGRLQNYYCNVNIPPQLNGSTLSYIDLDIDILVQPDYSYRILDVDDFEQNAIRYGYSNSLREETEKALAELTDLISRRDFPFDS